MIEARTWSDFASTDRSGAVYRRSPRPVRDSDMRSMETIGAGFLLVLLLAASLATTAYATSWYLMAADEKLVGEPQAAVRLSRGSVAGPFQFTSRGEFASREECEKTRNKLVEDWRKQSLIQLGAWDKLGLSSPREFIRCVSATDPHLRKSATAGGSGQTPPSIEILLRAKPRR